MFFHVLVSYLRTLPNPRSRRFFLIFFINFIVCFTFKFLIYLELIFVKGARFRSRYFFLSLDIQFMRHFSKRISFLHWISFALLAQICCSYVLRTIAQFYIHWLVSVPPPIMHSLYYHGYIISLEIGRVIPLTWFFLRIVIVFLLPLPFHINFWIMFVSTIKILLEFW